MQQALAYIRDVTVREPRIAVVLGSGLGGFADELDDRIAIPYAEIPGWPVSTAVGHAGKLVFGKLGKLDVAVMAGRSHLYEGYTPAQVTMGVRVLHRLGARSVVFTNAAGRHQSVIPARCAGADFRPHQLARLESADRSQRRFARPALSGYDGGLFAGYRANAHQVAANWRSNWSEGVYAAVTGPSYETPAEIRYLRTIGADLVGMSTVPEVIVANYLGMRVLAISCVTNMAAGILPQKLIIKK